MRKLPILSLSALALCGVAVAAVPVIDGYKQATPITNPGSTPAQQMVSSQKPVETVEQSTYLNGNNPVNTANQQYVSSSADSANLPLAQRVTILENKLNAQNNVQLLQRVNNLQQQVRTLQGRLDVANHDLKQLSKQQKTLYADIDQRLAKLGKQKPAALNAVNTTPAYAKPAAQAATATTPIAPKVSGNEQQDYQAAYKLVQSKQYSSARAAFTSFLAQYPAGQLTPNAHYWLGELYLQNGDFSKAGREFNTIVSTFPKSAKTPDALLKLGYVYYDTGEWVKARQTLNDVRRKYPSTTTARLAAARLRDMSKQGL